MTMVSRQWEAELDASYPAQPSQIPAIRRAVADIARARGAGRSTIVQIKLAVSEAATNAVLHAYRDGAAVREGERDVRVVVRADGRSCLDIRVRDRGVGPRPRPDSPGLGLGLGLIAHDADDFEIRALPEGGTEVALRFAL